MKVFDLFVIQNLFMCVSLSLAHANPSTTSPITIHCGPGINNCASDPSSASTPSEWILENPGTIRWRGTDFTITYNVQGDAFTVHWHDAAALCPTWPDCVEWIYTRADKLRALGYTP
jgi:hypothetical protein